MAGPGKMSKHLSSVGWRARIAGLVVTAWFWDCAYLLTGREKYWRASLSVCNRIVDSVEEGRPNHDK